MVPIAKATWAQNSTVKLSVPTMNCAMCPITVRKALENVDGVEQAEVDYKTKSAVVIFDTKRTNINALTLATQNAGFPSTEINKEEL